MSSKTDQEGEQQGTLTATKTNRPILQSLGNIDEDDISLPLSLIKGLRHRTGQGVKASTAAADSLSSESNTSDKDDSGGDETGGSNTSSGAKMCPSLSIGTFGPMSSLSGSEPNDGSNSSGSRAGILRKNGNNASKSDSMSTSSSSEDIAGDELSTRVVARAKSVSNSESYSHQQPQIKVSFAPDQLCTGDDKRSDCSGSNNAVAPAVASPKRKRDLCETAEDQDPKKKARTAFSDSNSGMQSNQQSKSFNSVAMVSSASSNTGSGGSGMTQSTGLDSSCANDVEQATSQNSDQRSASPSLGGSPILSSSKHQIHQSLLLHPNKHNLSSEERRLERNQREKERSNRIASQVDTLRCLLQRGGLYIPKNTKSTVLTEASNYIRTLQDRQQLMSMEMENLKGQLLKAMAAKQGVQADVSFQQMRDQSISNDPTRSDAQDYHLIFNNTMAGMAVASMGGALIDCNAAFTTETGLAIKPDIGTTIFNIVHPKDLSRALELISQLVDTGYNGNGSNRASSPQSSTSSSNSDDPVFIRSSFPNRPDLGLCISLVRSEDNVAKCFNITLVKNAGSNGEEFNPSLPAIPSMVPQISTTSSEASSIDQVGDLKAQALPQPAVASFQVQPQANVPQVQPQRLNTGLINNVVLNNSTVPVPPLAMTPVIPTVTAGVGGAAAVLPPQLMQLIQQLQQQPAQQQIPLFNFPQYQQQLQQIPIQNQLNFGNAMQGSLAMAGQASLSGSQQGSLSGQQESKRNDDTVYHYSSG